MKKKVLVVDDEPEQIDYASTILEEEGYIAISATNGVDGIRIAKAEKPHLILLDIMMPQKGGVGMYQDLKADVTTKDIPVVIVTGVTRGGEFDDHMVTQGEDLPPPDGYVEKPMSPDAVLKLVKEILS